MIKFTLIHNKTVIKQGGQCTVIIAIFLGYAKMSNIFWGLIGIPGIFYLFIFFWGGGGGGDLSEQVFLGVQTRCLGPAYIAVKIQSTPPPHTHTHTPIGWCRTCGLLVYTIYSVRTRSRFQNNELVTSATNCHSSARY